MRTLSLPETLLGSLLLSGAIGVHADYRPRSRNNDGDL